MKLSKIRQHAARAFIFEQGRSLERSLYSFHFEEGEADAVLEELKQYQYADGGFGHALEPNLRSPLSTVIVTTHAFNTFREIGVASECILLRNALQYLLEHYDEERGGWIGAVPEIDSAPHAPWWNYTEERYENMRANPGIIRILWEHTDLVPAILA